ncbi:MAG: tRNA (adenosine(37)-N6)-dimethylallyltransferase MiaA [Chloroflexota bacterium]
MVALFGPTSSGKTRLSIELGLRIKERLGVEPVVISADSRQVYRYMDIGTSKTTPAEMRGIRHELIDVAEPIRKLELETYVAQAREHIDASLHAGQLPLIVGGTGVYVASLLQGWDVEGTASIRALLRREFPRGMAPEAHRLLRRIDRAAAGRVHPRNYEAVINALASIMAGSGSGSARQGATPSGWDCVMLGLDPGQRALDARVARTFERQMQRGLMEEIDALNTRYRLDQEIRRRGKESQNQVFHTHGYREFFEVAAERGKPVHALTAADLSEVRRRVLEHIQMYTRHQRAWFRKLPQVQKFASVEQAYRAVTAALRSSSTRSSIRL